MEIDYIFPRRSFSSKKSAHTKILTEWKTAFTEETIFDLFNASEPFSFNFVLTVIEKDVSHHD